MYRSATHRRTRFGEYAPRKILLLCLLVCGLTALLLTACTERPPVVPSDTEDTSTTETAAATEEPSGSQETTGTVTETETEPETEPETPAPQLSVGEPEINDKFTIQSVYKATPIEREASKKIAFDNGLNITVKASSIFYGTESAVDRDTDHWGNIMRYDPITMENLGSKYVVGEFTGDRVGEVVSYDEGTLTIRNIKGSSLTVYYSQTLGFNGYVCGCGQYNDDLITDILFYDQGNRKLLMAYGRDGGFDFAYVGTLPDRDVLAEGDNLLCGDYDGDGASDLILVNDLSVTTYHFSEGGFILNTTTTLPYAESGSLSFYAATDINSDHCADICCYMMVEDKLSLRSYYSRRDGHFGPYESEGDNKNLYTNFTADENLTPLYVAGGDVTGDGVDDLLVNAICHDRRDVVLLYALVYPMEAPAYDYSSHVIKTDEGYMLYSGGMYYDYNTDVYPKTEADHVLCYTSDDGVTWYRNLDGACFYLGNELGVNGEWWSGNTMDPEVLYVDGVYYMYYQIESYTTSTTGNLMGADRIGVATSTDGIHFTRHTESPAVVTDDPYSCFRHEEVLYVPDDPDGRCFWMYVDYVHDNVDSQFVRIRSADPFRFDLDKDAEIVTGFYATGNQLGYISDFDGQGNRLFVRITYASDTTEGYEQNRVPALQFSTDGLTWNSKRVKLAGCDMSDPREAERPLVCFLGMSTINGTGEIPRTADGTGFEIVYVTCTTRSAVAPAIFYSSEGAGKAVFTIEIN